eukprot:2866220-Amphidinium_carterae.1
MKGSDERVGFSRVEGPPTAPKQNQRLACTRRERCATHGVSRDDYRKPLKAMLRESVDRRSFGGPLLRETKRYTKGKNARLAACATAVGLPCRASCKIAMLCPRSRRAIRARARGASDAAARSAADSYLRGASSVGSLATSDAGCDLMHM